MKITETEEYKRLGEQTDDCGASEWSRWKKWGPYVSNRQWGTVREQYTLGQPRQPWNLDEAWASLFYDEADKTAYRWGEDGIFGISDDEQRLCFALALWNGKDPHLKERFYGLPGLFGGYTTDDAENKKAEGCAGLHGEDVKEYYFYLDNTPSHSYMSALYKYPSDTFPYDCLRDRNKTCDKDLPEFDILDTGVFDKENYFEITVEYAKKAWNDICIRIIVKNCSPDEADLHVLPQLWFRNTWLSGKDPAKPPVITRQAQGQDDKGFAQVITDDGQSEASIISNKNKMALYCKDKCDLLFTDNETRPDVLRPSQPASVNGFYKDNIGRYVCRRPADSDPPAPVGTEYGTKCAARYQFTKLQPGDKKTIELRLTAQLDHESPFSDEFETVFKTRQDEADRFYDAIFPVAETETEQCRTLTEKAINITEWKHVQRRALAGLLWSKQFYQYNVSEWLQHRKDLEGCHEACRWKDLNSRWDHLNIAETMLVPDKWEYPYFATWDSAFQAVAMALIDPKYAKEELLRFTDGSLMRDNGQMPGCEFGFDDVHPPIYAWAAWKVYEIENKLYERADRDFLRKIVLRLWRTLQWWRDEKRVEKSVNEDGKTIQQKTHFYRGGFLGLDNVSVLDRNQFDRDGGKKEVREVFIEQADASGWMGLFSLMMLKIAIEVGDVENDAYKTMAKEAFDCFWETTKAINRVSDPSAVPEWNMHDYWYYDVLRIQLPSFAMEIPLQYCSIIGVIPLLANECLQASQWSQSSHAFMEYVEGLFDERVDKDCNLEGEERHAWRKKSNDGAAIWLTMVDRKKLFTMMDKLLDEQGFLSPYGIRSLSKRHRDAPYRLDGVLTNEYGQSFPIEVKYEPGEAVGRKLPGKDGHDYVAHVFGGGNSNWRGPVWFPINFLVFDMLQKRHRQFAASGKGGEPIRRPYPTLSEERKTFNDIAIDLGTRLVRLFCLDDAGVMPAHGQDHRSRMRFSKNKSPEEGSKGETQAGWSDRILFYEYFNGDNGSGLGASHQTGWTALVANIIHDVITLTRQPAKPANQADRIDWGQSGSV